jgi:pyruvate formate lyase activating enzyme
VNKDARGIVFNVQKFSVHDGDGIRTLVFLKGCPLRCLWCSNPEAQRMQPEKAYNVMRCLGAELCGLCVKACPHGAVRVMNGGIINDRSRCKECFLCVRACPSGAQTLYGEAVTVGEVLRRVEEDEVFYSRSRGGITLSGGEAMAQPEFATAMLREARRRHVNTAMESSGYCYRDDLLLACANLDMLLYDIKHTDGQKHKALTGVHCGVILENLRAVCGAFPELPILVRTPVIPGFNDNNKDIQAIVDMIRSLPNPARISYELLPYHRLGQPKYAYLGRQYVFADAELNEDSVDRLKMLAKL